MQNWTGWRRKPYAKRVERPQKEAKAMKIECNGLVALTGEDLAEACADALALPRQPIVKDCLERHLAEPKRLGWCAARIGTGPRRLPRGAHAGCPPLNDALHDVGIKHVFYENVTDVVDFIVWSRFFADLHFGHAVLCGDSYSLYLASLDRLLWSVDWYPTGSVLHGVSDMSAWIESAIVENLRRGARDRSFRNSGFGTGQLVRLEEEGRLKDAVLAELFGREDSLEPENAWALRNILLRIGVYTMGGGWKVQWVRDDVPRWPAQAGPGAPSPICRHTWKIAGP